MTYDELQPSDFLQKVLKLIKYNTKIHKKPFSNTLKHKRETISI